MTNLRKTIDLINSTEIEDLLTDRTVDSPRETSEIGEMMIPERWEEAEVESLETEKDLPSRKGTLKKGISHPEEE